MPWTLHEWLGELFLFQLVDKLGYMGAVYVYGLIPPIAMAILAFALHQLGLRTAAVIGATTLSALLVIPYATIRPQAVSWIFFALLIGGLVHLRPERARWTLLLVPLFIAVGEPPRPVGHRARRAGGVRGHDAGRDDADVRARRAGRWR